ncbi:ABC transporter ATP-binding protein [bacterium]|nr:ABC transporter ATP-binding protein [bacterium]
MDTAIENEEFLRVENLTKSYGSILAVNNVSFSVKKASITILSGPDGSGKSTIFKMLTGLVLPDKGSIYLKGRKVDRFCRDIVRIAGYMPEKFSLYPDLSVEENLNFFADIHGVEHKRREELKNRLLSKTGMARFKNRRARDLSGGMKQKLALSSILLSSPELVILDEPTTGVDPLSRIEFFSIIKDLKEEGKTILLSTPYLDEAEKGDEIIFIKDSRIVLQDSIKDLKDNFPARIFRIMTDEDPFAAVENLRERYGSNVFMKGRYVMLVLEQGEEVPADIPVKDISEEKPALEDIYLYYAQGT